MATIGAIPSPPPKWASEIFECNSIVSNEINLIHTPSENSLFIFINGLCMTEGIDYDIILTGSNVAFNQDVLTDDGHVLAKYSYT